MSITTPQVDDYHGYIGGARRAHLEAPAGGLVCDTRLYKKDMAIRHTILAPADLHLYAAYTREGFTCPTCLAYAAATCTCADCVAAR